VTRRSEPGDHDLAQVSVSFGLFGVVADHGPFIGGDLDFLDLQVVSDVLVAALPGQRRVRFGVPSRNVSSSAIEQHLRRPAQ
jgi:hypothetical protein